MSLREDRPSRPMRWMLALLGVLAILAILLGLSLIGLSQRDHILAFFRSVRGTGAQEPALATEPWPTLGPTFTPAPRQTPAATRAAVPTALPTATPTPEPPTFGEIQPIVEANFIEFRGTTVVERESAKWWGKDWILLKVVGRIKVGIDLPQPTSLGIVVTGSKLTLVLPHAKVTSVEILPAESEILGSKQNWLFSEYPNLDQAAWEAARVALWEAAQKEDAILAAAENLATATLRDFCRGLGHSTVDVIFVSEDL